MFRILFQKSIFNFKSILKREMSVDFDFSVCRVCFAPECVANLSSLFEGKAEKAEKFKAISGIDVSFLVSNVVLVLVSDSFLISQISGDNGKHSAMICDTCLKELNGAYWECESLKKLVLRRDEKNSRRRKKNKNHKWQYQFH
jgi:hypothetical protein